MQIAYPMAMPPGVPPERVALMRKAFMDTMNDPAFRDESDQDEAGLFAARRPDRSRPLSLISQSRRRRPSRAIRRSLKEELGSKSHMLDRWRARIGWITPRVNSDTEIYDFYQIAPKDVVVVVNSLAVVDSARKEEIEASINLIETGGQAPQPFGRRSHHEERRAGSLAFRQRGPRQDSGADARGVQGASHDQFPGARRRLQLSRRQAHTGDLIVARRIAASRRKSEEIILPPKAFKSERSKGIGQQLQSYEKGQTDAGGHLRKRRGCRKKTSGRRCRLHPVRYHDVDPDPRSAGAGDRQSRSSAPTAHRSGVRSTRLGIKPGPGFGKLLSGL